MKLLLDQNLSYRLLASLVELYPESAQVGQLGMGESSDHEIWDYAKRNEFVIVTHQWLFGYVVAISQDWKFRLS